MTDQNTPSREADPHGATSPPAQRVRLLQNAISAIGFSIVVVSIALLITAGLFYFFTPSPNPYVDIVTFLVLPGVLLTGLLITPLGAVIKYLRVRGRSAGGHSWVALPRIDLYDRATRDSVLLFVVASVFLVLPVLAVSSYHAYHYTESTEFCGKVCHSVMEPEATAHAGSPHARVTCADCHIGSGASWFVKSKLSGVRQVFAVIGDTYSRPIPPAIHELRPARDTCEECHWPSKFFGSQLKEVVHYSEDEANTRRTVRMLLKTGGADPTMGRVEGIHMHMVFGGRIQYVATDPGLQQIPWVRYVDNEGKEQIYRSDGLPHDDPPPAGAVRTIDCMDCHNRGAHHFRSPQAAMDLYLNSGRIDATLPYIKHEAVKALTLPYKDAAQAEAGIERELRAFYEQKYPALLAERGAAVAEAIAAVQDIYRRNFFPQMKVDWRTYPENIGHLNSPGCMRCHDGRHLNREGVAISSDCDVCHTFLNAVEGQESTYHEDIFHHSMKTLHHESLQCIQCHSGGPLKGCRDCHASGEWLDERGKEMFKPADG